MTETHTARRYEEGSKRYGGSIRDHGARKYERGERLKPAMGVHGRIGIGALIVAAGVTWEFGLARGLVVFGLLVFGVAALELVGIIRAIK